MYHTAQKEVVPFPLPTPTDTPYRTPPRSRSPQLRRHPSASAEILSSPLPLPPQDLSPERGQDSVGPPKGEDFSPLDPRRFTPSLHASLVSEILSLRREADNKNGDIEHLEATLHTCRNETESLQEALATNSKETRSLRRQQQMLEGGTAAATIQLTKERDDALNTTRDLRQRQEQFQRRLRSQEEAVERTQLLWDRDRDAWDKERRALETKVHIVEGRLRVVSSEIANSDLANGQIPHQNTSKHESPKKMHFRRGSSASLRSVNPLIRRRDSEISSGTQDGDGHESRRSTIILTNGVSASLADELAFDEEEEGDEDAADQDDRPDLVHEDQFPADELFKGGTMSAQLGALNLKARKILGLSPEDLNPLSPQHQNPQPQRKDSTLGDEGSRPSRPYFDSQHTDAGVQYSPPTPPTPFFPAESPRTTEDDEKSAYFTDALSHQAESETTTRAATPTEAPSNLDRTDGETTSASCQAINELPTPPRTPMELQGPTSHDSTPTPKSPIQMAAKATQTDFGDGAEKLSGQHGSVGDGRRLPISIPAIAIHPPHSRPSTPTSNVTLPPHTRNASCQVDFSTPTSYISSSMQTTEMRKDTKSTQLPRRSPSSRRLSQRVGDKSLRKSSALQPAKQIPPFSSRSDVQPGSTKLASLRRKARENLVEKGLPASAAKIEESRSPSPPLVTTHLPEYVAPATDQEQRSKIRKQEVEQTLFDEEEIFNRPIAKFTLRAGKMVSSDRSAPDYQDIFEQFDVEAAEDETSSLESLPSEGLAMPRRRARASASGAGIAEQKPRTLRSTSSKQFDIRKAALISSGAAAHQSSGDTNAVTTIPTAQVKPPPFPVPTRHSSRNPPPSVSEGAQTPTPGSRSLRRRDSRGRKPTLRKARSATNNASRTRASEGQHRNSPPQLPSLPSGIGHTGLSQPQFVCGDATAFGSSKGGSAMTGSAVRRPSPVRSDPRSKSESGSTGLQQTSVVDAIAQTMVGEWMFKYVRRRKSFGVPEPRIQDWDLMRTGEDLSTTIANPGVRHRRWVWLAPYERAVMWSSKQPTTGLALMGKSGRKLQIHSVLDVRDNTPLPRGSSTGPQFNRSILILTPERALKFTATSQERHYLWLNALSFLCHSPLGFGDLTGLPHAPQPESAAPKSAAPQSAATSLRRNPILDSIRVGKGRDTRSVRTGGSGRRSFTDGVSLQHHPDREAFSPAPEIETVYEPFSEAADPPIIPRYHGRTRSHTAPRPPSASFRNFSSLHHPSSASATPPTGAPPPPPPPPKAPSSAYSMTTVVTAPEVASPPLYNSHPHGHSGGSHSGRQSRSHNHNHHNHFKTHSAKNSFSRRHGSEASGSIILSANAADGGYFDPYELMMPTMRMEAFIEDQT